MKKLFRRNDLLLAAAVLAAAVLLWGAWKLFSPPGAYAVVTVDGAQYARLPLVQDAEMLITDANGGTNLLVISGGEAYILRADCGNQVCVHTGRISEAGETIVCLPHKVVVAIEE